MSGGFLRNKLSSFQIIIFGFVMLILVGTVLLTLPISTQGEGGASFEDALFTSTSAACVTGLVTQDTATYWSGFGQAVILVLIQIGGLGVISVAAFIATISGRKISLFERSMLQDSISAHQIGGVVRMTGFIFKAALIFELAGALALLPSFCTRYGAAGIWMSFFHSISAFCNAGFDVMGGRSGAFSSMTSFAGSPGVVIPISLLIIIGGIGFLTWDDIYTHKFRFKRYRTQTKVVLVTSGLLILIPAVMLFFGEYAGYPAGERVSLSLFQAITPRTAGFNTADLTALTGAGRLLIIILMFVGGSPGSTAGGMKTTTLAVLFSSSFSVFRRKKSPEVFGRRIEDSVVKSAAALLIMYLSLALTGAVVISMVDGQPFGACIFETASAIGTVGLTLGITPSLSFVSHFILILLMFFGRVGGLTLMYAAITNKGGDVSQRPVGKISVG